jgi:hypothetical protein
MLCTPRTIYRTLESSDNFELDDKINSINRGLLPKVGNYFYIRESLKIPVYRLDYAYPISIIYILRSDKMGHFIQYPPLNSGEDHDLGNDVFYFNIRDLAKDRAARDELLEKQPEWLKEKGERARQDDYLKTKVRIEIYERYSLVLPTDFEGYSFYLDET